MTTTDPSAWLDRHQASRDSGLPAVSVLAGPVGLATRSARRWAEWRGRAVVPADGRAAGALADAWIGALAGGRDLAGDARACLGLDDAPRLARMAPFERALLVDSAGDGGGDVAIAARWVLERRADGVGLADRIGPDRAVVALAGLVPAGAGPVFLARDFASPLPRLALLQPRLTAILAVDPAGLATYLGLAPESREKALIRSGVVAIAEAGAIPAAPGAGAGPDDGARSEAERFLADCLARDPATAGLFELNARLDIPFGPGRMMEVDLASRALRVAVEVDGYHHFRDEDGYRRDRRKDYLLQDRGYLVVRVLAEDVVRRLEDVLALIRSAVASRRADFSPSNRDARP